VGHFDVPEVPPAGDHRGLVPVIREPRRRNRRPRGEGEIDYGAYWVLSIYGYLLIAAFGFLTLFLSLLVRRGKSIVGAGIGIVLGAYVVDVLGNLSDKGAALARLSPFHYLNTGVMAPGYGLEMGSVLFFVAAIAACAAAALPVYRRKDILV